MACFRCGSANDPATVTCSVCGQGPLSAGDIHEGALVAARYEVRRSIGSGGMGIVYQAYDRVLDEDVAIKVLRPEFAARLDMARRFRQEIKLARRVRHRNVCGIHEYGEIGDLRFIAMEYVRGVNLRAVLRESGPLPPAEAFALSLQVAKGLQAIHEVGIIHRDLKTSNIMLDESGRVRLMDFGIAKQHGLECHAGRHGHRLHRGHAGVHEPGAGPRRQGGLPQRPLLAGRRDLRDLHRHRALPRRHAGGHAAQGPDGTSPLTGPAAPALPEPLVPVLAKVLAKAPDERYAEAGEMVRALRDAAASHAVPTVVAPEVRTQALAPAAEPRRRRFAPRPWVWAAGLATLLLSITAGVSWRRWSRASPPSGTVLINALPWAEVDQIVDGAGRPWPAGPNRYTPSWPACLLGTT